MVLSCIKCYFVKCDTCKHNLCFSKGDSNISFNVTLDIASFDTTSSKYPLFCVLTDFNASHMEEPERIVRPISYVYNLNNKILSANPPKL